MENSVIVDEHMCVALVGFNNLVAASISHYLNVQNAINTISLSEHDNLRGSFSDVVKVDAIIYNADRVDFKTIVKSARDHGLKDQPKICVFREAMDPAFTKVAFREKVDGIFDSHVSLEALPEALRLVVQGERFVPATVFQLESIDQCDSAKSGKDLTALELSVLSLMSEGDTNKEVALKTGSTEVKVKMWSRSICQKLNARNRTHACMIAVRLGMI